jgi:hypothetical protein
MLPRQLSDIGGHLSGAAGVQRAAIRGGYESLSSNLRHRRRMQGTAGISQRRAGNTIMKSAYGREMRPHQELK